MSFKLKGEARWAFVQEPNQFGKYSIDLVIDEATAKKFQDRGVSGVKVDEDGSHIVQCRTNAFNKDGDEMPAPTVTLNGAPFDKLVGNGSEVEVTFDIGDWTFGKTKGKSAYLRSVDVLNLVEYSGDSEDFSEDDEPF